MITYTPSSKRTLSLFKTPFEQQLDPANRWVVMAEVIPWDEMSQVFFKHMSKGHGRASIDLRIILGALLVKHLEGISDEDTIQYIQENIYAQYFVGLPSFQTGPVFVPSLFVEVRKRLGKEGATQLNDIVLRQAKRAKAIKHRKKPSKGGGQDPPPAGKSPGEGGNEVEAAGKTPNKGTLKVDATVAPQHVGYPTDTRLLAEARQYSEELIDKLYQGRLWKKKPRTYRRKARKEYLAFSKKRAPQKKTVKQARGKQLRYLRRNLKTISKMLDKLAAEGLAPSWQHRDWQRLWVIQELYRQQDIMHRDGRRRIDGRIVNIAQPYVRPIQRGKAGKKTEFGAKLNMSETEGFVRADQISFDNFNEGGFLMSQVEAYKALYGYYPELVLADRIYLTRKNRKALDAKDIRNSGLPLGRRPSMTRHEKQKRKKEQNKRSEIEGKFGQAKSKYGLDDIKTKRKDTSMACIALILMALNVIKLGRAFLRLFYCRAAALASNLGGQLILNLTQGCNLVLSRTKNLIILHRLAPPALTF
jgi:transposase, IS5 family